MDWITSPEAWIALLTLTVLEIVLGIDNIVFISILSGKLPANQQARARTIGLGLAMGTRVLLLLSLAWIMKLTAPLFSVLGQEVSGRDLILLLGGLFLIWKATHEIHERLEGQDHSEKGARAVATFGGVLVQIALLDVVFSLDSVITAVGMAKDVGVMITAIVIAVGFMMFAAGPVSRFVERHPTVKMLALSFLLLIGVTLIAEGFGQHVSKGYVYFAMGFSVFVEALSLRAKKVSARAQPATHTGPGRPVR
jgi:predicted tellurium resistance membrane protein TerC